MGHWGAGAKAPMLQRARKANRSLAAISSAPSPCAPRLRRDKLNCHKLSWHFERSRHPENRGSPVTTGFGELNESAARKACCAFCFSPRTIKAKVEISEISHQVNGNFDYFKSCVLSFFAFFEKCSLRKTAPAQRRRFLNRDGNCAKMCRLRSANPHQHWIEISEYFGYTPQNLQFFGKFRESTRMNTGYGETAKISLQF